MLIIGCDYHPSFQQIAWLEDSTGEYGQRRLEHNNGEAQQYYRSRKGQKVLVGVEATGSMRWFERLLAECGHELWWGHPGKIRAAAVGRQKYDKRDAALILRLLLEQRFPRLWVPSVQQRDERQLVLHRHRLVQMRTRVKNQLQALAMNEGVQRKHSLWSVKGQTELQALSLDPWARVRRTDLLELHQALDDKIAVLNQGLEQEVEQHPEVRRLMTHPGVGPVVATAFVLTIGDPGRFANSKQVAAYLGLVPLEESSGGRQRLGHITKAGNSMLRGLLVEAVHVTVRHEAEWRRKYMRLAMKKNRSIAAVALARCLAARLWWMWKLGLDYGAMKESRSHAESLV
jgi:transposase